MTGTIDFKHDEVNDVLIVTPHWNIENLEDCKVWYNQWVEFCTPLNRKLDCIMVLKDFRVSANCSVEWGKYRVKALQNFSRFSYRVNQDLITGIFVKTSGVRYNASTKEANSVEAAIAAIKEDRKKEGIS